jgi:hypothetical protein
VPFDLTFDQWEGNSEILRARCAEKGLKRFVEGLLRYHLKTGRLFTTPEAACRFLSKPRDPEMLRRRIAELRSDINLHKRALEFHKPPDDE